MTLARHVLRLGWLLTSCLVTVSVQGSAALAGAAPAFGTAVVRPLIKDLKAITTALRQTKTAADAVKLQQTLTAIGPTLKKDVAAFDTVSPEMDTLSASKTALTADQTKAYQELKEVAHLDTEIDGLKANALKLNPKLAAVFTDLDL